MALVWIGRAAMAASAVALAVTLQAASAHAAPKGQGAPAHGPKSTVQESVQTADAVQPVCVQPTLPVEPVTAPADDAAATPSTGETTAPADGTTAPADGTTAPTDDTTAPGEEAPAPADPCAEPAPAPAEKPGKPVNLADKGKAAQHNPNVDAEGNLIPGSAASKSAAETEAEAEAAKVEKVAEVKAESRAQAKADRSGGEKSAYLIYVNGKRLNLTPLAREGRTLVPFRRLAEFLGAEVTWEPSTRTVIMVKGEQQVSFSIGSTSATVNGEAVEMPIPSELVEGSTFVPLRFIASALGADVDYDAETGAITVITTDETPAPAPGTGTEAPAPGTGTEAPAPAPGN